MKGMDFLFANRASLATRLCGELVKLVQALLGWGCEMWWQGLEGAKCNVARASVGCSLLCLF